MTQSQTPRETRPARQVQLNEVEHTQRRTLVADTSPCQKAGKAMHAARTTRATSGAVIINDALKPVAQPTTEKRSKLRCLLGRVEVR